MKILIRELYYLCIALVKKIQYKHIRIGFRGKISNNSTFEGFNKIEHHAFFAGDMGYGSYIGEYSNIIGKVGRYCSIGGNVTILSLTHPVKRNVSTSPCFYSTKKQAGFTYVKNQKFSESRFVEGEKYPVIIGNDVYIGYGVIIIAPVVIGDGAVVAAGSVVTKNVEPYSIVAGNPAKTIRKRFEDEEIEKLLAIRWWDKDKQWINEKAYLFQDIKAFLSKYNC